MAKKALSKSFEMRMESVGTGFCRNSKTLKRKKKILIGSFRERMGSLWARGRIFKDQKKRSKTG
jgi:hypothetical protein